MRKREGLTMRRLGTEAVIVAESRELIDFDRLVSLNRSAAYIWEATGDKEFDTESLADLLTARYDVDAATARRDASELLAVWLRARIVVE